LDDALVRFYLDAHQLTAHIRPLSAYDRLALRQCTDTASEFRELIYQGAIRGHSAPGTPGQTYLQHLYHLLIPPEVEDLSETDLLIIAPHGPLHALPFHALLTSPEPAKDGPLAAHVTLAYVPSLSALQSLFRTEDGGRRTEAHPSSCLALGLSDFGDRARPLPHAADEIAALRQALGERVHVLWGDEATQAVLLRLNETEELAGYDVVHFAAHAVLDHLAPSQSRILLADGNLTFADILELKLRARLVVLAACEGALGQRQAGDEIMGLAQAFFFAGARSVIASLWPVEDGYVADFMGRFYRQLSRGESVAQGLHSAQVEMAREDYVPYQWAPFITIGLP
jgi:CHAT domain-containing protein